MSKNSMYPSNLQGGTINYVRRFSEVNLRGSRAKGNNFVVDKRVVYTDNASIGSESQLSFRNS